MATAIYHVLNRGVDKRKIFLDDQDRYRFIHDLYEFNDQNSAGNLNHFIKKQKNSDVGRPNIEVGNLMSQRREKRKLLVDVLVFCLMRNHYHLMLRERVPRGIPLFMKKLNGGYAKYFNEKYKRAGALFQGKYKSVLVVDDAHFVHLPYYIHLNPLDFNAPEWRERKLDNYKEAIKFLGSYRWSSHLDYCGRKNFPSVTNRSLLASFFGGTEQYEKHTLEWLKDFDQEEIRQVALESHEAR